MLGALLSPARLRALLALSVAVVALPNPARADMAKPVVEGERVALLAPDQPTAVRVDRGELDLRLGPDLAMADVVATYQLTNTGAAAEGAEAALALVLGETSDLDRTGERADVKLDGARVDLRAVSDASLLRLRLNAWLADHPTVVTALQDAGATDPPVPSEVVRLAVEAAGGRCPDRCRDLVVWYAGTDREAGAISKAVEEAEVVAAAREVIPSAVADVARGWPAPPGARLGFLRFHVDVAPGAHTLTVRYPQRATVDHAARANPTYRYGTPLAPAKRWASFGPLDVTVHVPSRARFASATPFWRDWHDGDVYHAELPALSEGELSFETMSTSGLWLGMDEPRGYWAILLAAMAAGAIAVGGASGRLSRAAARRRRVLLGALAGGSLSVACNLAVLVVLLVAFPPAALGFAYAGAAGGALLVLLSLPAGALAGAVSGAMRGSPSAGVD